MTHSYFLNSAQFFSNLFFSPSSVEKINDIISLCDIQAVEKSKESFPTKHIEKDLDLLLEKNMNYYIKEAHNDKALQSLMCLVNHNDLLKDKTNHKKFRLGVHTLN